MAIEVDDGDVARWVTGYTQHLTSTNSGNFTSFTGPSEEDVDESIDTAEAEILAWLAEVGYNIDTTTWPDTPAKRYLSWYNSIGAAYRLELFHPGLQFTNQPNTRFEKFHDLLMELKESILNDEIGGLGIPKVAGKTMQTKFTGRLISDKEVNIADTDVVPAFFDRHRWMNPRAAEFRSPIDPLIVN